MSLVSLWMILQLRLQTTFLTEVTDHTNEFSLFMDDLTVKVTDDLTGY
jgi:hypothetical protein